MATNVTMKCTALPSGKPNRRKQRNEKEEREREMVQRVHFDDPPGFDDIITRASRHFCLSKQQKRRARLTLEDGRDIVRGGDDVIPDEAVIFLSFEDRKDTSRVPDEGLPEDPPEEEGCDRFVFFWKENHPFSNWYKHEMTMDGVTYNCSEQAFMAAKARMFDDADALDRIMAATSCHDQKKIGKQVRHFKDRVWKNRCRGVMHSVCLAKFSQDERLKEILLRTGDRTIVEASPQDTIWGIGLRENDPRARDPKRWRGTNWLGESLMAVRSHIREAETNNAEEC